MVSSQEILPKQQPYPSIKRLEILNLDRWSNHFNNDCSIYQSYKWKFL